MINDWLAWRTTSKSQSDKDRTKLIVEKLEADKYFVKANKDL